MVKEKIPSITTANVELVISGVIAMMGNNNEKIIKAHLMGASL